MPSTPLPMEVRKAGWISFWADVASEMAYPVIPLFVVGALNAPATTLGLIEGMALALISVMRAISGWHSDATGKRMPYVRAGYALSAVAKPLMALAFSWPGVLASRLIDRFGKGLRTTARDALIADSAEPGQEGRAFGFHRAMDSAGAVVGSLCGFLLLTLLPGQYRLIFLITAVPGAVAVLIAYLLHEPRRHTPTKTLKRGSLTPQFWLATAILGVFALANSSDTFILLRARDSGLSAPQVALVYALFNVTYSAFSYSLGSLSDRIGKTPLLVSGWLLYALVYFLMARAGAAWFWLLLPMYGLYMAATDGVSKALVGIISPPDSRGSAMGVFYFISGALALVSSLLAGWLWDSVDHAAPFYVGSGLAVLAALLAAVAFPKLLPVRR